jgi:aspartyl-tRNA(Asn)/glutamyl-tRNA(Gln) amidotransferase subunit C
MNINAEQIKHVAKLARLALSPEEVHEFSGQLSAIIDYVEKINSLDVGAVEPAEHIAEIKNVFREDVVGVSLTPEQLAQNAPMFENGHIAVPKIIE